MNASNGGPAASPALTDFILLNAEIAALARARMPLESHLSKIGRQLPRKSADLTERITRRLSSGESFQSAFDAECGSMPAVYRATIMAGVESGQLGKSLESMVDTASRVDQLRHVTGIALLYPLIVIGVASSLFAFVITRIVPAFGWLNQLHFGPLERLSHYPDAVAFLSKALPALAVFIVAVWWWRSSKLGGGLSRFGLFNWMPGWRKVRHWSEAATFAELMLLLVESNVPLDRALRLLADATQDRGLRDSARRIADRIERGEAAWPSESKQRSSANSEFSASDSPRPLPLDESRALHRCPSPGCNALPRPGNPRRRMV